MPPLNVRFAIPITLLLSLPHTDKTITINILFFDEKNYCYFKKYDMIAAEEKQATAKRPM